MSDRVVSLFESGCHQPRLLENQVTVAKLRDALELAVFSPELDDDGDIYVREGVDFPFWIIIDEPSKMIRFFTYWSQQLDSMDEVNNANCYIQSRPILR